jgi:integrative and conjugative element protein (TIGR02256 family)
LTPLVYRRRDGSAVKLSEEALLKMFVFRQIGPNDTEAGGVLLGRFIIGSRDVVVDDVTVPMPGDARRRFEFRRSKRKHQAIIDRCWRTSGGTCLYLGEWHTHPEPSPSPSPIDLSDWLRRLREDRFDAGGLFFFIVGTVEVGGWEAVRVSNQIVSLSPEPAIGDVPEGSHIE